jgi:hypothetical protein
MLEELNNIEKEIPEYIEVQLDIAKLQIAETLSRILNKAVNLAIIGYLLFFILLFLSFAAGYFISSCLKSDESGFLCVAGFYFLLLMIFLIFRKQIIERPIIQAIVKMFFSKFNDNEKT